MDPQLIFSVTNSAALAAWIALALAPLRRGPIVFAARAMAGTLAASYAMLLAAKLVRGGASDLTTLSGVSAAMGDPSTMAVAWIHFLAFDLWIGAWEVEEAGRRGLPHLLVLPCLALTFLFGPVGLVLFLILGWAWRRRSPKAA